MLSGFSNQLYHCVTYAYFQRLLHYAVPLTYFSGIDDFSRFNRGCYEACSVSELKQLFFFEEQLHDKHSDLCNGILMYSNTSFTTFTAASVQSRSLWLDINQDVPCLCVRKFPVGNFFRFHLFSVSTKSAWTNRMIQWGGMAQKTARIDPALVVL